MDIAANYSYKVISFDFEKVMDKLMTRAVRVKTTVKDKIEKNFTISGVGKQIDEVKENLESKASEVIQSSEVEVTNGVYDYKNEETVHALATKLDRLETQKKVLATVKRVVLYTKELANKNARIMNKWFTKPSVVESVVPSIEPISETPQVEPASMEQIVPDTWDKFPTVEVAEPESISKEEPTIDTPIVTNVEEPREIPSFDFPTNWMPEIKKEEPEIEKTSITDRLNSMLNSNSTNYGMDTFTPPVEIDTPIDLGSKVVGFESTMPEEKEDSFSQTSAMARLVRIKNELKEKDLKIKILEDRIGVLNKSLNESTLKNRSYEMVNRDLSEKNRVLDSESNTVRQEFEQVKVEMKEKVDSETSKYSAMVVKYEAQIKELEERITTIEREKEEALRDSDELGEQRLAKQKEQYEKQLRAVYSTISEVLGTNVKSEESEGYAKAA